MILRYVSFYVFLHLMSVSCSKLFKEKDCLIYPLLHNWASLVAQMVKNLPVMLEAWVQSLGQEDPLEKGLWTHSSILAWRIPWTEETSQLQSMGSSWVGHDSVTNTLHTQILADLMAYNWQQTNIFRTNEWSIINSISDGKDKNMSFPIL